MSQSRKSGSSADLPATEAGRALLAHVKPNYTPPESGKTFTEHIAAIEAEAVALVQGHSSEGARQAAPLDVPDPPDAERLAEVLEIAAGMLHAYAAATTDEKGTPDAG